MMSAQDARTIVDSGHTKESENQIKAISDLIEKAVENSKYSCYYYEHLLPGTTRKLQELGYKVNDYSDQRDGVTVKISW